jgi:hypothetical protein
MHEKGDTIKATYVLHLFPLVAVFAGAFLSGLQGKSKLLYRFAVLGLLLTAVHNIFAMVTHYSWHRFL